MYCIGLLGIGIFSKISEWIAFKDFLLIVFKDSNSSHCAEPSVGCQLIHLARQAGKGNVKDNIWKAANCYEAFKKVKNKNWDSVGRVDRE